MPQDDYTNEVPPVSPPIEPAPVARHAAYTPEWTHQPQKHHGPLRKILMYVAALLFLSSIVMNVYLVVILSAMTTGSLSQSVIRIGQDDQVVAVYTVAGIIDGKAAAQFEAFYYSVREDDDVKAIVIRVDSPGGGVSASDQMHQMIHDLRNKYGKKVVISMGGVAASGGYYISAPADMIYAEPTTITGSVGVIMLLPVLKDFLDSHGIDMMVIRSDQARRWKAAVNYFEKPDEEVFRRRQALLTAMHEKFEQVVRSGRGLKLKTTEVEVNVKGFNGEDMTVKQIEPLNGLVYMADAALKIGLVDEIGYVEEAIDAAAELANLDSPKVVQHSRRQTLRERLGFSDIPAGFNVQIVDEYLTARPMMLWRGW